MKIKNSMRQTLRPKLVDYYEQLSPLKTTAIRVRKRVTRKAPFKSRTFEGQKQAN